MGEILLWAAAVTGVVFIAELIAGRHRKIYTRHDYIVGAVTVLFGSAVRPFASVIVASVTAALLPRYAGALSGVSFWIALPVIILAAEFMNYWVHRFAHEKKDSRAFDWLWRMHRTHHTAGFVNVLLIFRLSLFWGLVAGPTWVMSFAIYLGQEWAAGVALIVFALWGIVTHSDFRWDNYLRDNPRTKALLRAFEHIVITPGTHHSHHGWGKDGGNYRNFGILLAIYDWAFGTLHIPSGRPARYGLPGKLPHWADDAFSPIPVTAIIGKARATFSRHSANPAPDGK